MILLYQTHVLLSTLNTVARSSVILREEGQGAAFLVGWRLVLAHRVAVFGRIFLSDRSNAVVVSVKLFLLTFSQDLLLNRSQWNVDLFV